MKTILSILITCASVCLANAGNVALATVESNGDSNAIGDYGNAKGKYQFWRPAWEDTTKYRKALGLKTYPYSQASNRAISDEYATSRMMFLTDQLKLRLRRTPTSAELYAAWNLGLTGFARRHYQVGQCPAITQRAAAQFSLLAQN